MGVSIRHMTDNSNYVKQLIERRDGMESELDALADLLKSHNADMDTPLVTADGFPRADIDVAQIREARSRIIKLQNDIKNIMGQIEQGLVEYFKHHKDESNGSSHASHAKSHTNGASSSNASTPPAPLASSSQVPPPAVPAQASRIQPAFAVVRTVQPSSPADTAGVRAGDRILTFGPVNASNHQNLSRLSTVVRSNQDKPISVSVMRQDQTVDLTLTPRVWAGQGTLGCHIVPL